MGKLFNQIYRGFFNTNTNYLFKASKNSPAVIVQFNNLINNLQRCLNNLICDLCFSNEFKLTFKSKFTCEHNKILGASQSSDKGMPNTFWNCNFETSCKQGGNSSSSLSLRVRMTRKKQ